MPDTLLTLLFSIGYFFLLSSIPYFHFFKNNNISILNLITNKQNSSYKSTFLENYNSAFLSYKETYSIVSKNRKAMDKIVDLLIEKETLDGEEFVQILSKFTTIPEKERTPQLLN